MKNYDFDDVVNGFYNDDCCIVCGEPGCIDACVCGAPLCPMHFETGAGFCNDRSVEHQRIVEDAYNREL